MEVAQGSAAPADAGAANVEGTPQSAAEQKAAELYRLKVDGEDLEVDLEELKRGYGHNKAATKKFQQAAEMERAVRSFVDQAKGGDLSFLKHLTTPEAVRQWAEKELLEYIEYETLPPHEKEIRKLRSENELTKKELAERNQREQAQAQQAQMQAAYEEIDNEIGATLKELGRKPTPRLVRRIAEQMFANLAAKEERLPAKIAMEKAVKGLKVDLEEFLSTASKDDLIGMLPKAQLEQLRKYFVEEVQGQAPFQRAPLQTKDGKKEPASKYKRMPTSDYFANLDKKYGMR